MELRADAIHDHEFPRKVWWGYDPDSVDGFLDQVEATIAHILAERAALQAQLSEREQELASYRNLEAALQRALVNAEATAERVLADSRARADNLLMQAVQEAEAIVASAHAQARRMLEALPTNLEAHADRMHRAAG